MTSAGAPRTVASARVLLAVVALREIAAESISVDDLKEDLIHSMQKHVEVDEPEEDAVPSRASIGSSVSARNDDDLQEFDRMSEEDLLRGLDGLVPPAQTDDDEG